MNRLPKDVSVETIVFTAGTSKTTIKDKLPSKLAAISEPFYYVSDNTCDIYGLGPEVQARKRVGEIKNLPGLDKVYSAAARKTLESLTFEDGFCKLAQLSAGNIKTAYIILESITDHIYGFSNKQELQESVGKSEETFADFISGLLAQEYPDVTVSIVSTIQDALAQPDALNADSMLIVD